MSGDTDDDDREAHALVEGGAELVGALAVGGLGLIGGPVGALGGAALGVTVTRVVKALGAHFSARERVRVGAAVAMIAADSEQRREHGQGARDDGFFDERGGLRPDAEELLEGVLRQAAGAYEERKVPLLAHLYAEVAHDETIPAADAQYLVRLSGELTWRQFVALSVLQHHDEHFRDLARAHGLRQEGRSDPDPAVLLELDDLSDRRLVGVNEGGGHVAPVGAGQRLSTGGASDLEWGRLRLSSAGELLVRATGAAAVPAGERSAWVAALRRGGG
jgi:hypothetical protein